MAAGSSIRNILVQPFQTGQQSHFETRPDKEDGRYSSLLLLIYIICLYIVVSFATFVEYKPIRADVSNGTITLILLAAVVVMLVYIYRRKSWQTRSILIFPISHYQSINMRQIQLSFYGIYLFGTGVIVYSIFRFVQGVQCLFHYREPFIVLVIYLIFDVSRIIFITVQLIFFRVFKTAVMVSTCWFRYTFTLIIAANMCCWFEVMSMEAKERLNVTTQWTPMDINNDIQELDERHISCYLNSTTALDHKIGTVRSTLVPFVSEYSIMAAGILFRYWECLLNNYPLKSNVGEEEADSLLVNEPDVFDSQPQSRLERNTTSSPRRRYHCRSYLLPFIATLISILLLVSASLMFKNDDGKFVLYANVAYIFIEAGSNFCMCFVAYFAFKYISPLKYDRQKYLNNNEILCLISIVGLIIINICTILSSVAELLHRANDTIELILCVGNLLESLTGMVEGWLQTSLIIAVRRRLLEDRNQSCLKECLLYLAIGNLAMWIHDSFIATNLYNIESMPNVWFFGESTWNVVNLLFVPIVIYYRFHNCIMFTGAYVSFKR
ncbi:proton channel OtopLc-like [Anneissia japonica]|uniref:proton channel OtopLc-like n=1 Tax=Anneissia japonica TaxID=1529436 RepID=UPI001425B7AF|nr:proton channel OtopLc-like [Anneissia japonica]